MTRKLFLLSVLKYVSIFQSLNTGAPPAFSWSSDSSEMLSFLSNYTSFPVTLKKMTLVPLSLSIHGRLAPGHLGDQTSAMLQSFTQNAMYFHATYALLFVYIKSF
jgi:hypothetical protein